jgi:hypothetical protein
MYSKFPNIEAQTDHQTFSEKEKPTLVFMHENAGPLGLRLRDWRFFIE